MNYRLKVYFAGSVVGERPRCRTFEASVKDFQASGPRSERELVTTATDETAIMAPAALGLRVKP